MSVRKTPQQDQENVVATIERPQIRPPNHYNVVLYNDDYTPMDFVVQILIQIFQKSTEESVQLMLKIHHQDKTICGVYSHEIAETKVAQVLQVARKKQHPLRCTMEKKS